MSWRRPCRAAGAGSGPSNRDALHRFFGTAERAAQGHPVSIAYGAAHIATMANPHLPAPATCTPYAAGPAYPSPEPPELDYKFFTPEFLDELEEHYRALAVGRHSA